MKGKKGMVIPIGGVLTFLFSILFLWVASLNSTGFVKPITLKGELAISDMHMAEAMRKMVPSVLPFIAERAVFEVAGDERREPNRLDIEELKRGITEGIEIKIPSMEERDYIGREIAWEEPEVIIESDSKYFFVKGGQSFILTDKTTGAKISVKINFDERVDSNFFEMVDVANNFFENSNWIIPKTRAGVNCDDNIIFYDGKFNVTDSLIPLKSPTITGATPSAGGEMPDGIYDFKVSAIDKNGGITLPSNSVECEIKDGNNACLINWEAVENAESYRVFNGTNSYTTAFTYHTWSNIETEADVLPTEADAFYESGLAEKCKDKNIIGGSGAWIMGTFDCSIPIDNLIDFSIICGYRNENGLAKLETLEGQEDEIKRIAESITEEIIKDIKGSLPYDFEFDVTKADKESVEIDFSITDPSSMILREGTTDYDKLKLIYKSKTEFEYSEEVKSCSDLGGQICEVDKVCSISVVTASNTDKCCLGVCEEKECIGDKFHLNDLNQEQCNEFSSELHCIMGDVEIICHSDPGWEGDWTEGHWRDCSELPRKGVCEQVGCTWG